MHMLVVVLEDSLSGMRLEAGKFSSGLGEKKTILSWSIMLGEEVRGKNFIKCMCIPDLVFFSPLSFILIPVTYIWE